jgi:hypothetical protein
MTDNNDPYLDPDKNKCVTCGLFRIYTDPKLDTFFASLGKLHESGKINYKINRRINEPKATIFCSLGLPQAMEIDEPCQFHQPKLDYPPEHYSTIHAANLSIRLAEETKLLTAKTKCLAVIAIIISVVLGLGQLSIAALQIEPPVCILKFLQKILALFP